MANKEIKRLPILGDGRLVEIAAFIDL